MNSNVSITYFKYFYSQINGPALRPFKQVSVQNACLKILLRQSRLKAFVKAFPENVKICFIDNIFST